MFTETKTLKYIKDVIDGKDASYADVSVKVENSRQVQIVIGAKFKDKCSSYFMKDNLQKLINNLQEVCDLLDDKETL